MNSVTPCQRNVINCKVKTLHSKHTFTLIQSTKTKNAHSVISITKKTKHMMGVSKLAYIVHKIQLVNIILTCKLSKDLQPVTRQFYKLICNGNQV